MSDQLNNALLRNRRRMNRRTLRQKLKTFGLHAELGSEEDLGTLRAIQSAPPLEDEYMEGWANVLPRLKAMPITGHAPVLLAPFDFEKAGVARVNGNALIEALSKDPLNFDRDGFWIVGEFGAILADFDNDHLDSDILWRRYGPLGTA